MFVANHDTERGGSSLSYQSGTVREVPFFSLPFLSLVDLCGVVRLGVDGRIRLMNSLVFLGRIHSCACVFAFLSVSLRIFLAVATRWAFLALTLSVDLIL